jgi:transcriptional regulator with XRE-family HTH domain
MLAFADRVWQPMPRRPRERNARILGQRIREARESKGWTQELLAFHTGLDRSYVGSVERGERNVNFQTLVRIARALEVSVASLVADLPC